jgi:pimeloyl-ACP methyl ester carboxylesterase
MEQRLGRAPQDLYIEFDGARLRYRDEGAGPAVLFLHGWTLDLDMWEFQADALTPDFRVVRLDRRGFGLSSGLPSLAQDVLDAAALCRHLKIGRIALVGMSQGARVALELASAALIAVSCLVLDGPPRLALASASGTSTDLPYEHYRSVARRDGMPAFRREWMLHPLARLRTRDRRAQQILSRMIERYPGRDLLGLETNNRRVTSEPERHSPLPPLLLISGEHDLDSRRCFAKQVASELPQPEHVDIAGAGHLCNLDNPSAYSAALIRFLAVHAVDETRR